MFLGAAFCYAPWGLRAQVGLPPDAPLMTAAQAQEWRQLRLLKGHFEGGPWNEAIDRWQGRKHQLMLALAADLLSRSARTDEVLKKLGRPDAQLLPRHPAYKNAASQLTSVSPAGPLTGTTGAPTFWLYHWRGHHDQLVFSVSQGRVSATGWLHTFE